MDDSSDRLINTFGALSLAVSDRVRMAIAEAFSFTASWMSMTTLLLSSVRIDVPASERRQTGLRLVGGTSERSTPRAHIRQSACSTSGRMLRSMRSTPEVGPMMNP